MPNRLVRLAVISAITLGSSAALALPFNSFDPRSMAMGGAGVAVANTATAPFFNPSLLSVMGDDDDFALELPVVGVRAYDPEEFRDSIDTFQDSGLDTRLTDLVTSVNSAAIPTTPAEWSALAQLYRDAALATDDLNAGLQTLDAKPLQVDLGAATVIGVPGKSLGVAFSASAAGSAAGIIHYQDGVQLSALASDLTAVADYQDCLALNNGNTTNCPAPTLQYVDSSGHIINPDTGLPFDGSTDVKSSINVRALIQQEFGLSLAHKFDSVAVGITPKLVKTRVYDYFDNATSALSDNKSANDYMKEYSDFNVDIGAAKDYANGWRTGLVVKNLISHEYEGYRDLDGDGIKDPTGYKVKTSPQARLGVSHSSGWHTVALDVDLTENEPVDFEEGSRFVALGVELNAADWAQLRLGYRVNTVDSSRNVASAGVGLSPLGIHLDVGVAGNANEIGASAQFGFRF